MDDVSRTAVTETDIV